METTSMSKNMLDCLHKNIRAVFNDGEIIEGRCSYYSSALDNNGVAEITIKTKHNEYISADENEIKEIQVIN